MMVLHHLVILSCYILSLLEANTHAYDALARNDSQRGNNEKRILKTLENDYKNFVEDEKLVDVDLDKVLFKGAINHRFLMNPF